MKEKAKAVIRAVLCRLLWHTEPPYQCYWRDRAFAAEKEIKRLESIVFVIVGEAQDTTNHNREW